MPKLGTETAKLLSLKNMEGLENKDIHYNHDKLKARSPSVHITPRKAPGFLSNPRKGKDDLSQGPADTLRNSMIKQNHIQAALTRSMAIYPTETPLC